MNTCPNCHHHYEIEPLPADKWTAEKAAHARGEKIESRLKGSQNGWWHCVVPAWHEDTEYRIAPAQSAAGKPTNEEFRLQELAQAYAEEITTLRAEVAKQAEEIARLKNDIEGQIQDKIAMHQALEKAGLMPDDATVLGAVLRLVEATGAAQKQIADAMYWNGKHAQKGKELADEVSVLTGKLQVERAFNATKDAEIARLSWRPVSVKPTEADADREGFVFIMGGRFTARLHYLEWGNLPSMFTHWRPFSLPPAPTVQDEMEAAYQASLKETWMDASQWNSKEAFEKGWQAVRTSKEVQP